MIRGTSKQYQSKNRIKNRIDSIPNIHYSMSDSESIIKDTPSEESNEDELSGLVGDIIRKAQLKIAVMLFITILLVNSDVFIESIMSFIPGTALAGCPTNLGSVIQASTIVLIFVMMAIFVS